MKKIIAVLLSVGTLYVAGFAQQQEECKFCKTKIAYEEKKIERLKRELGLTQNQAERLKQIIREEREAVEKFMKEHKIPFKEAIKEGSFKREVFVSTVRENAEKMATIKAQYLEKILETLDENQKKKFIELMEKRFEKKHERMKESFE